MGIQPSDLKSRASMLWGLALGDPVLQSVFGRTRDAFFVGGGLRDYLFGGALSRDFDVVINGDVEALASDIAREFGASLVVLGHEGVYRVVFSSGLTLDISRLSGDIAADLRGRDLTINAIGWSPETGVLDPTGGINDLIAGQIRVVARDNLIEDPLRLLRIYRFGAAFGFEIAQEARTFARELHAHLNHPAGERITAEFFHLLSSEHPEPYISMMNEDGILSEVVDISQNNIKNYIKDISIIPSNLNNLCEQPWSWDECLGLNYVGLLRLEALLIQATGHGFVLSRDIADRVVSLREFHDYFMKARVLKTRDGFRAIKRLGPGAIDLAVITGRLEFVSDILEYQAVMDNPVISGDEIMRVTGIGPGIDLGKVIENLRIARFMGEVESKDDAIRWLVSSGGP